MARAVRLALLAPLMLAAPARAEIGECHVVDVKFTPAMVASTASERHEPSQIVVWLETPAGEYKGTLYITQQTGRYGLGNRPGRFDFNSGPMWPYGRRTTTFPVWAKRHGLDFPSVVFQNCCHSMSGTSDDPNYCATLTNDSSKPDPYKREFADCGENNLSHPFDQSSREQRYCQPYQPTDAKWIQADAMTCATLAYTDKGRLSPTAKTGYPPRTDVLRTAMDSPSVEMFKALNPFDAVSQATPPSGQPAKISWPIPEGMPVGDYVLWIEVAQAFDHNATYSTAAYPAPPAIGDQSISWATYGLPYRGQPSILYKVPFTIGTVATTSITTSYEGYGDPSGVDGLVRAPDSTITIDTPGSGASRLQLVSESGKLYRVLVNARPEFDYAIPGAPESLQATTIGTTTATLRFIAPGDDGLVGAVTGYEVRYFAGREMTADNFAEGNPVNETIVAVEPGALQLVELTGLLPETDYWVGIRALDDCRNTSDIAIAKFTTADRIAGEVDACFVATAAYGSLLANDVEMLRHVRDSVLRRSIFGELAIESYYTFGPAVAGMVSESDLLRSTARDVLEPIVARVRKLAY